MKTFLLFLVCSTMTFATEYTVRGNVLVLTDSTIGPALEEFDYVYCLFEGPLQARCGMTVVSFYHDAEVFANISPNIKFANVDCNVEKEACATHEIEQENYHVEKFFIKGKNVPIPIFERDMVNWLKRQIDL